MHETIPKRRAAPAMPVRREPLTARLVVSLDRRIYHVARHWLLAANLIVAGWFFAALLAPILRASGWPGLARPIYALFGLVCHQDPSRGFAVGGHPVACCHRCAAIYGASAAAGIGFATLRGNVRRARPIEIAALLAPALIDGVGGLAGLWDGTMAGRLVIGTLAGIALTWLVYPFLADGFAGVRTRLETLFARLAAEGRFQ